MAETTATETTRNGKLGCRECHGEDIIEICVEEVDQYNPDLSKFRFAERPCPVCFADAEITTNLFGLFNYFASDIGEMEYEPELRAHIRAALQATFVETRVTIRVPGEVAKAWQEYMDGFD